LAKVNDHVQNLSRDRPYEFSLRLLNLIVEPAQHIPAGIRMIVLNEPFADSQFRKHSFVVAFQKVTPIVTEDSRFE
jgi:hypothetical protein